MQYIHSKFYFLNHQKNGAYKLVFTKVHTQNILTYTIYTLYIREILRLSLQKKYENFGKWWLFLNVVSF